MEAGSGTLAHSLSEPLPTAQKLSLFMVALPPLTVKADTK